VFDVRLLGRLIRNSWCKQLDDESYSLSFVT